MTKKNKNDIELIKTEIKVPKHWHDHILEWAKKHGSGFDSFEEIILSFTHRYMENENNTRKQLLDDFSKGFIEGYVMGGKYIPNNETMKYVKWNIPHTLKAEALTQMALMKRELS